MTSIGKLPASVLFALICVFSFGLAAVRPAQAASSHAGVHVYLLRGIMDVSEGMDVMAARLNQLGIRATAHSHTASGTIASQAKALYQSGAERRIILIGHSLGATGVLEAARELKAAGVPVALVVTLDPVFAATVPSNVAREVNFYVGRGQGQRVTADQGFHGSLSNEDFSSDPNMGHMEIQRSPAVQRRIIGMVFAAIGGGRPSLGQQSAEKQ